MSSLRLTGAACLVLLFAALAPASAWTLQYGHTWGGLEYDRASAIEVDGAGNVYVTGTAGDEFYTPKHAFVAKFDPAGRLLWDRFLTPVSPVDAADALDATLTADGTFLIVGEMYDHDIGQATSFVAAFSPAGDLLYAREIPDFRYPTRIQPDPASGGAVVLGSSPGYTGAVLALDSSGGVRWGAVPQLDNSSGLASPWGVAVDPAGQSYIYSDREDGGVTVTKFDPAGAPMGQKTFISPASEYTWDAQLTPDGGVLLLGTDTTVGDVFLTKMDPSLEPLWSEYAGRPGQWEDLFRLVVRPDGSFWVLGGGDTEMGSVTLQFLFEADGSLRNASYFPTWSPGGVSYFWDAAGTGDGGYAMAGQSWGVPPSESVTVSDAVVRPADGRWEVDAVRWPEVSFTSSPADLVLSDPVVPVDDFRKSARDQAWYAVVGTPPLPLTVDVSYVETEAGFQFSSAVANGVPPLAYRWSFGDGTFSEEEAPLHRFDAAGVYLVQLFVEDSEGRRGYDTVELSVKGPPTILYLDWFPRPAYAGYPTNFFAYGEDLDGGSVRYDWAFGDGAVLEDAGGNVTHVYELPGSYELVLTVVDDEGDTASRSATVDVIEYQNIPPSACFIWFPSTPATNSDVYFDASCSSDPDGFIAGWQWDFGDGTVVWANGSLVSHVYSEPGTYVVVLTVTDNLGDVGFAYATIYVRENQPPVAVFVWWPASPQPYEAVYFYGGDSYDPDSRIVAWLWDFGDGSGWWGGDPYANHAYVSGGDYVVTLTVVDEYGATGSLSQVLHVNLPPVAVLAVESPTAKVGTPLSFDGTGSYDTDGGTVVRYLWEFGDGGWAEGAVVEHAYAEPGSYVVRLIVWDEFEGAGVAETTVAVLEPKPPLAIVGWSPARPGVGQEVTFDGTASVDPDGSIETYIWQFGDGAVATGAVATHAYGAAGTYAVKLTVIDEDGLVDDDAWSLIVSSTPRVGFQSSPSRAVTRQSIAFTAAGSHDEAGIVSYRWSFGDDTFGSGYQVSHAYAQAGTYRVTLEVTNVYGVTASASRDVVVEAPLGPKGSVLSSSLEPVFGVQVSIYSGGELVLETFTQEDGSFSFGALDAGVYSLEARGPGYAPRTLTIQWDGRGGRVGSIVLEPVTFEVRPLTWPRVLVIGLAVGSLALALGAVQTVRQRRTRKARSESTR